MWYNTNFQILNILMYYINVCMWIYKLQQFHFLHRHFNKIFERNNLYYYKHFDWVIYLSTRTIHKFLLLITIIIIIYLLSLCSLWYNFIKIHSWLKMDDSKNINMIFFTCRNIYYMYYMYTFNTRMFRSTFILDIYGQL